MYVYRLVHSKKDVLRVDLRRKSKEILLGSFLFLPEFEYCPIERILKIWKIMGQLRMYHRGVEIII